MQKKVAICQSNYIPWKGYFDLISKVGWDARTTLTEGLNATYKHFSNEAQNSDTFNNREGWNNFLSYCIFHFFCYERIIHMKPKIRILKVEDVTSSYVNWFKNSDVIKYSDNQYLSFSLSSHRSFVESCLNNADIDLYGIFDDI